MKTKDPISTYMRRLLVSSFENTPEQKAHRIDKAETGKSGNPVPIPASMLTRHLNECGGD